MNIHLKRNLLSVGTAVCLCFYIVAVIPSLGSYCDKWSKGKEKYTHMEQVLKTLPDDASLNVSSPIVAHVSDHDIVYEINYHKAETDVDYVVFYYPYLDKDVKKKYLNAGYTVWQDIEGELLILKKGEE